jgi:nucleoid-associated protein YgaU
MTMFWDKLQDWFEDLVHDDDPDTCQVTVHTVQAGDKLRTLAKAATGDAERYKEIVAANPNRAWDADYTIYVGEKLRLPKSWVL